MEEPMPGIEILDDLFFIQRGYLNANHFVSRSSQPVLIDTGYKGDAEETRQSIEALGVDLADVSLIINTHTHCDHVGGNRAVQERSGCGVALHPIGRHFIDTRDDWSTWWRYFDQDADFFDCTRSLADGEMIRIGRHPFRVIYTPGHASDGIVLYHEKEQLLISSDTLWESDLAVMTERIEGSAAVFRMLASLDRLAALAVRRVYPGHGPPFDDCAGAIDRAINRLNGYLQDRRRMGQDLLKKLIVYTLLMKKSVAADRFYPLLMQTHWYPETIDRYFQGAHRAKYNDIIDAFISRDVIRCRHDRYLTTVPS
jgi:glyoxylase-like metal-dependent hydrolase (beta-lactamase superfamily II)